MPASLAHASKFPSRCWWGALQDATGEGKLHATPCPKINLWDAGELARQAGLSPLVPTACLFCANLLRHTRARNTN